MGEFRNGWLLAGGAWAALGVIFCANLLLLISWMVTGVEGQAPPQPQAHPGLGWVPALRACRSRLHACPCPRACVL